MIVGALRWVKIVVTQVLKKKNKSSKLLWTAFLLVLVKCATPEEVISAVLNTFCT